MIPILVRSARIPREDELPDEIRPLARRQAMELSDNRWESDLANFERALDERLHGPARKVEEKRAARFVATPWRVVAGLVLIVAVVVYFWNELSGKSPDSIDAAVPTSDAGSQREAVPTGDVGAEREVVPDEAQGPGSTVRHALALPKVFRFRLGGQPFEILAMRTEPSDANTDLLTILLRMTNIGRYPDGFVNLTTALELDQKAIALLSRDLILIAPQSAAEGEMSFPVPKAATRATLWVKYVPANEETRIPLPLAERRPFTSGDSVDDFGREKPAQVMDIIESFPVGLPLPRPREFQVDMLSLAILDMRLDRYNVERAVLEVGVRARASKDSYGSSANFDQDCLRLMVDGIPRAAADAFGELLAAGETRDARFEFLLADMPKKLELQFRYRPADHPASVPIELPSPLPSPASSRERD